MEEEEVNARGGIDQLTKAMPFFKGHPSCEEQNAVS
jgi:hypothetical protein